MLWAHIIACTMHSFILAPSINVCLLSYLALALRVPFFIIFPSPVQSSPCPCPVWVLFKHFWVALLLSVCLSVFVSVCLLLHWLRLFYSLLPTTPYPLISVPYGAMYLLNIVTSLVFSRARNSIWWMIECCLICLINFPLLFRLRLTATNKLLLAVSISSSFHVCFFWKKISIKKKAAGGAWH